MLEFLPTDAVIPYERNNKVHEPESVERIARSIKEFGWTQPILIDEDSVILAGHKRLLAAKELSLTEVPTIKITGLSEAQKQAYRIVDNKSSEESDWDFGNLELELNEIRNQDFDIDQFIVEDFDFEVERAGETEDDAFQVAGIPETSIRRGDLIELGPHRLLCGDSTLEDDVRKLLDGRQPALMVTDPPYGVEYDPEWRSKYDGNLGTRAVGVVTNDDVANWGGALDNFKAPVLYVWHAARYASVVAESLEKIGFQIISQIIWNKPHFVFSRGDYHWKHEPCWYAVKKGHTHNWQGDRTQSTVWDINNNHAFNQEKEERTGHSTQKPLECMARPIRNNSKTGDLIVDPFLGSGSTLIAADELDRVCCGIEIEPGYCQIIVNRYKAHCEKKSKAVEIKINGEPLSG